MSRDGRRGLTQDERVLWTVVTKAIEPLRKRSSNAKQELDAQIVPGDEHSSGKAPRPAHPDLRPAAAKARSGIAAKEPPPSPKPQPTALDRRTKQRVARGKQPIDARLDLHGLTQAQAHAALLRFLRDAQARDAKMVLVITGKGRGGEMGVLRRQVPQWLTLPEFREAVIDFDDAHIAHGGEGALYVRLRRAARR